MKKLAILGSTGSIGSSALEIIAAQADKFQVLALTGHRNISLLEAQIRRFKPRLAAVPEEKAAVRLQKALQGEDTEILWGVEGLKACAVVSEVEMVVSAIVGSAGLLPTMAAMDAGKDIALANKETLVVAGSLVMDKIKEKNIRLFPVDSEHSAIFQSLQGHRKCDVRRLILTASGGPFLDRSLAQLKDVTPKNALAHPNWQMGKKISIDSATMMNKGLEVIEARWLFDLPAEKIDVHIHPQSVVHSMVEYVDGAVIAQLGVPDMKTPIAYALSYPERICLDIPPLDLCSLEKLTFSVPDQKRFECLALAYEALRRGGTSPAVLNAANEVAVESFLSGAIRFSEIAAIVRNTLRSSDSQPADSLDAVLEADRLGRETARQLVKSLAAEVV
ncbi:MAG: 1-deoxy-D-xylulose-5-phosphate reductoisomerase [Deltaproteobacteria bacterium]|nr:1-deoxy-D-xylulose-5-phosphate reductoisomerase [Deltaproteobacteria bacterium]